MGCDYYIYKYLIIKLNNNNFPLFIELEKDRGYFNFELDEDDPDYDKKYKKYIKKILTPNMEPILIYEKNQFVNSKLENKYKFCIQEELNRFNKSHEEKIDWANILDINKIETREERD
jgi:predicted NUDIX family phosphoesterase